LTWAGNPEYTSFISNPTTMATKITITDKARAIAAAAIAEANRKAGTADERNLNTLVGVLTLPRLR
jgi:hypothetical protein